MRDANGRWFLNILKAQYYKHVIVENILAIYGKLYGDPTISLHVRNFQGYSINLIVGAISLNWKTIKNLKSPPLGSKVMKNAFCFTLKAIFVLKIFTFLSWLFGYVEKRLDNNKAMVNFKIYDVTDWIKNNFNTYYPISQEVKAVKQWNLVSQ